MQDQQPNDSSFASEGQNNKTTIVMGAVVVFVLVIIGWFVFRDSSPEQEEVFEPIPQEIRAEVEPEPEPMPEPEREPEPEPEPEPVVEPRTERVQTEPEPEPLPNLRASTPVVMTMLNDKRVNTSPVRSDNLIRDLVVFIDNIAAGTVSRDSAVIGAPDARFQIQEIDDQIFMDPRSYERYNDIVEWFVGLDNRAMVDTFKHFEPLFNEAYAEISRPGASFRERVQRAVNVLNAAPAQSGLIELNADKIMYTYADERLESLPAAQKQMLRLGPDNMAKVKRKLNALVAALN